MTKQEAIQLIEQALNVATKSGAFNIEDVGFILKAMDVIKADAIEAVTAESDSH